MPRKPRRISARVSDELKTRMARLESRTGLSEAQQIEACVAALLDYFEAHGEITLPLRIVPRAEKGASFPTDSTAGRAPRLEGSEFHPSTSDGPTTYRAQKKPKSPKP
jgi:hypothetical protein